jgi:type VI protein secretion system component Hcp
VGLGFSVSQVGVAQAGAGAGRAIWTFAASVAANGGLPPLLLDTASQKTLTSIVFEFDSTTAASPFLLRITLTDALITSTGTTLVQNDGSATLALTFGFATIAFDVAQPGGVSNAQNTFDSFGGTSSGVSTAPVTYGLGALRPGVNEEISAFTPQTEQVVTNTTGAGAGRANFGQASIVTPIFDATTLNSVALTVTGANRSAAHVLFFPPAHSTPTLTYDFANVLTSSVSVSGLASTVSFSAEKVQWTSFTFMPDGTPGGQVTAGWNVATSSPL